jgi:hypothetical protein
LRLDRARALTVAVDLEVETSIAGLKGLETSDDLDSADLRKFYEQARLAREGFQRWMTVALVDPSGRQALNLEHTTRGLPEMIDIRKSAGGPGAPRSEPPGGSGAPGVAD